MSEPPSKTPSSFSAFLEGFKIASTSVFVLVLVVTYIGFGALAHDFGFSVGWAMLSTLLLWAGPAQVILLTALGTGTSLIETALAVCLSSVRLLPLVFYNVGLDLLWTGIIGGSIAYAIHRLRAARR